MSDKMIMESVHLLREVQEKTNAKRKYSGKPYIFHPLRVMTRVALRPNVTPLEICAALLHDVHEDPPFVPLDRIERQIHPQVAKYVSDLSNPSKKFAIAEGKFPPEWNRQRRKEHDRLHLKACDFWTQTIKADDRHDNIEELTVDLQTMTGSRPPLDFIYLYCKESELLADDLNKIEAAQREELKKAVNLLRTVANTPR